ncbi:MAG: hypothetical protein J1E84_07610 [Muribaculaceae bacterium]|nr:hypothetical protein [Muribaculaceae bacterium]
MMKRLTRCITAISVLLMIVLNPMDMNCKKNTPITQTGEPDFRYPEKVITSANVVIKQGVEGEDLVSALMQKATAMMSINPDSISAVNEMLSTEAAKTKDNVTRTMIKLLQANYLHDYYQVNRWKLEDREVPAGEFSTDIRQWGDSQFKDKVISLVEDVTSANVQLQAVPITSWKNVILQNNLTAIYYPTLWDFAAYYSLKLLEEYISRNVYLPETMLTTPVRESEMSLFRLNSYDKTALMLAQKWVDTNQSRPAPRVIALMAKVSIITSMGGTDSKNRYDALKKLYQDNIESEYSGEILAVMVYNVAGMEGFTNEYEYLAMVKDNIARYPSFLRRAVLDNIIATIQTKAVNMKIPDMVYPGAPFKISIETNNVYEGEVLIYRYPEASYKNQKSFDLNQAGNPYKRIKAEAASRDSIAAIISVDCVIEEPGYYVACFSAPGMKNKKVLYAHDVICVSEFAFMSVGDRASNHFIVGNLLDGTPVEGVTIEKWIQDGRNIVSENIGVTDSHGRLKTENKGRSYNISYRATKGKMSTLADRMSHYYYPTQNEKKRDVLMGEIAFSRTVYRPGDTVEWTAYMYITSPDGTREPAVNWKMEVNAYDINGNDVVKDTLQTDGWGRLNGKFDTSREALTGYYRMYLKSVDSKDVEERQVEASIMVSDYKLPTFFVEDFKATNDLPGRGDVTLKGRAVTYSGFPLANAKVEVAVQFQQWYRWMRDKIDLNVYRAETGADGCFEIVVPAELFGTGNFKRGYFMAEASVASSSGETVEASTVFTIGYKYRIETVDRMCIMADNPAKLDIKVISIDGTETPSLIDYTIIDTDGKTLVNEQFNAPNPSVDLSSIPSGTYRLRLALPDTTLAEPVETTLVLYRPSDTKSPLADEAIWFPTTTATVEKGNKATFGFEAQNVGVHLTVAIQRGADADVQFTEYVTRAGYNTIEFDKVTEDMVVAILGYDNLRLIDNRLNITVEESKDYVEIKTETFRDRLNPSATETWRFKIENSNGKGVESAVMLRMFNKSLEEIARSGWFGGPSAIYHRAPFLSVTAQRMENNNYSIYDYPELSEKPEILRPNLKYCLLNVRAQNYNMLLGWEDGVMYASANTRMMKSASSSVTSAPMVNDMVVVREHKEEIIVEDADYERATDTSVAGGVDGGAESGVGAQESFQYRDREVAQALFKPLMVSGADGSLTLEFEVPNANTTWVLNMFAYTREMLSAHYNASVVAARQVMVQPNLPRFLRHGDVACVKAIVMNNSETDGVATTVVELFNPSTGEVVATETFENEIRAGESATISSNVEAPADGGLIGYRIKTEMNECTDGEQTMLPVLESVQPVYESNRFFMAPTTKNYTTEVSSTADGEKTVLTFCENPAWEVVSALPGLRNVSPTTATGAAYAIFSAAVARGLMKDNPAISAELQRWLASDRQDSTLVSMLSKNEELKTFVLNATPWVQAAESDSERMTRLALLFDNNGVDEVINTSVATLQKLNVGGGWKWTDWGKEPSLWITQEVLYVLGRARQLGYMPADKRLNNMVVNAVAYTDNEVVKMYRKYPKSSYSDWAIMRLYYKDIKMSTAAQQVNATEVQRAISGWGKKDIEGKAWDALLLVANGYKSTAKEIVQSLREFSESTPEKGIWWPRLDNSRRRLRVTGLALRAYAETSAPSSEIDAIRQWLIGEKQTQDWGCAAATTDVIADILTTSKNYFGKAGSVSVSVAGEEIALPRFDSALGMFKIDLGEIAPTGGRLDVIRLNETPSYGAVMTIRQAVMEDIEAVSTEGLSIEKKLYLMEQTPAGLVAHEAREMKVGDLVRVELIITVDRQLDYVAIEDRRPACLEPVEQTPAPLWQDGVCFYRENRDAVTNLFVDRLPHGVYRLHYDMRVNNAGEYSSGIATIQSQYAPDATAHSSGSRLQVNH